MAIVGPDNSLGQRWRDARDEWREVRFDVSEIGAGVGRIAQGEARLAVAEVRDGIRATVQAATVAGIAVVISVVTLAWLPLPLLLVLAETMPLWAAALVTVGSLALVGLAIGILAVRRYRSIRLVPREALQRLKEDKEWLAQQLSGSSD